MGVKGWGSEVVQWPALSTWCPPCPAMHRASAGNLLTIFLAAVTRFDHGAADSEAQPHSAGFTKLLGLGRGKYNNILQRL